LGAAARHNSLLGKGEDSLDLSNKSRICGYFGPEPDSAQEGQSGYVRNPERKSGRSIGARRYALVLKGLAYDFSVAGPVTDPRQCLERLVANNGRFYSECRKK
jgi:hypothetical protein